MPNIFNLTNSIKPNGIQKDDEGYSIFYPLGTNKIDIPTDEADWPHGDTLKSPFVYQDNKLVGFCDTKAMTANSGTTITLPYNHIEIDFSSIQKGTLIIKAPNAITKKVKWMGSSMFETILGTKYLGCKTVSDVQAVEPNYQTVDIVDGVWTESLEDLEDGSQMFSYTDLASISSDLHSLTNGSEMFRDCSNLTTFDTDLSALTDGTNMFENCSNLTSFISDLSSLIIG